MITLPDLFPPKRPAMDTQLQKQRPVTFFDCRLISGFEFPLKDYKNVALKFATTQMIPSRGLTISCSAIVGFGNAEQQQNRKGGGWDNAPKHELGINEKRKCNREEV